MGSSILNALLEEKINSFKYSFSNLSNRVFYDDENKKLIHPAEYGTFREEVCKNFLHFLIPSNLEINQGFIINSDNKISTQCDIIFYDKNITPLIENSDRQRFFPVETVCAVGEIKSTLTKAKFKETLNKLARVNQLKESLTKVSIHKSEHKEFNLTTNHTDNLVTFIICQKLDFKLDEIPNEINSFYNETNTLSKHNMILSISDGILLYHSNQGIIPYPMMNKKKLKNSLIEANEEDIHIKVFASNIFLTLSSATVLFPDMGKYIENTFNTKTISIKTEQ